MGEPDGQYARPKVAPPAVEGDSVVRPKVVPAHRRDGFAQVAELTKPGNARDYLHANYQLFVEAIIDRLGTIAPPYDDRATWPRGGIATAFRDALAAVRGDDKVLAELPELLSPTNPWFVIDHHRTIVEGTPAHVIERPSGPPVAMDAGIGKNIPPAFEDLQEAKGPLFWNSLTGDALAIEVLKRARESLGRMLPRYLTQLEDKGARVAPSDLVTSHPMDRVIARVLCDKRALWATKANKGKKVDAATFPSGLRFLNDYHWLGEKDPHLWNWLEVVDPKDATPEEVAATLWLDPAQSHRAYGITASPPFFRVQPTWARQFDKAKQYAPAGLDEQGEGNALALADSRLATEAAIAQSGPLRDKNGKPIHLERGELKTLLDASARNLDEAKRFLRGHLFELALPALHWVAAQRDNLAEIPDDRLTALAPVVVSQREILSVAVGALRKFIPALTMLEDAGGNAVDHDHGPLTDVVRKLAIAIGESHLAQTGWQQLQSALAAESEMSDELMLQSLRESQLAVQELAANEGEDKEPSVLYQRSTSEFRVYHRRLIDLRASRAAGKDVDSEVATLNARISIHSVETRAYALNVKLDGLCASVAELTSDELGERLKILTPFIVVLPAYARTFQAQVRTQVLESIPKSRAERAKAGEGEVEVAEDARKAWDRFVNTSGILDFIRDALAAIEKQAVRKQIAEIAFLIGVSIAGFAVGQIVGGAVRGFLMARMGANAVRFAQLAELAGVGANMIADAGVNTLGQGAAGRGGWQAFFSNLASNAAFRFALGPLHRAVARWGAETRSIEAVGVWTKTLKGTTLVLREGAVLTTEMITSAAVTYIINRVGLGEAPDEETAAKWGIDGASLAIGKFLQGKFHGQVDRLARLLEHGQVASARVRSLEARATAISEIANQHEAMELLIRHHEELVAEKELLESLSSKGKISHETFETLRAGNAIELGGLQHEALSRLTFHMSGLVPDDASGEAWAGDASTITKALQQARRAGLTVEVLEHDAATHRYRVSVGHRELVIFETSGKGESGDTRKTAPLSGSRETRSEAVPGSTFRGGDGAELEPKRLLETLTKVLFARDDVMAVERVTSDHKDEAVRDRASQTVMVVLPLVEGEPPRRITIRIDVAPLEGTTVAKSWINSTQEGYSKVESGIEHRAQGRHVIQISNRLDPIHAERAVAHEVGEIFEIDRLNFEGRYGGPDALRKDATGMQLSPHDLGRLAEIEVLSRRTDEQATHELQALIEYLGLREGVPGADARLVLAAKHLKEPATEVLRKARHEPKPGSAEAKRLEELRARARNDEAAERERAEQRRLDRETPRLTGPNGSRLTPDQLRAAAVAAEESRAKKSLETWNELRALISGHRGPGRPELPWRVMAGGGASLAARERTYLLIDNRGRWQIDGSTLLAQTAHQVGAVADAQLGDPRLHAAPNERLPLDAIRAWEDTIAAEGPVINGSAAFEVDSQGLLVRINAYGDTLIFRTSSPLIATGFLPEVIPGAPRIPVAEIVTSLTVTLGAVAHSPLYAPDVQIAAGRAHEQLLQKRIVTDMDATQLLDVLSDPALRAALGNVKSIKNALDLGGAVENWKQMIANDTPNHPHVFLGDQANIGREQALSSHNWLIAGTGGTAASAAVIILETNPKAHVTMVGTDSPAGLFENDQFRTLALKHGDERLDEKLGFTKDELKAKVDRRLSIREDRVNQPSATPRDKWTNPRSELLVDESDIDVTKRSKQVFEINGNKEHVSGTAYVAAIGRLDGYPPLVKQLIASVVREGGNYYVTPLFDGDSQYLGHRIRFVDVNQNSTQLDVTGAASRALPIADAKEHFDHLLGPKLDRRPEDFDMIERANAWDSPPESGSFPGGFGPTSTQGARYARYQRRQRPVKQ